MLLLRMQIRLVFVIVALTGEYWSRFERGMGMSDPAGEAVSFLSAVGRMLLSAARKSSILIIRLITRRKGS